MEEWIIHFPMLIIKKKKKKEANQPISDYYKIVGINTWSCKKIPAQSRETSQFSLHMFLVLFL